MEAAAAQPPPAHGPVTLRTLRQMAKAGTPFSCLTCYDATTARWLARAGIHVLLVGDTAAEMVLGYSRTIDMPLELSIALTAAVKRGAPDRVVMADMPFLSYQASADDAVRNAGRYLVDGKADVVKLEADASYAPLVERMTRAGIPVCAHVGSKPQHAGLSGGYASAGKTPEDAKRVVEDARTLAEAGAVLLLVEAVPDDVAHEVVRTAAVPVIGIGAGRSTHGQVLVLHDLLGLTDRQPPFAKPRAGLGQLIEDTARGWAQDVARRQA